MNVHAASQEAYRVTKETPVGFELVGVKKKAAIQLMGLASGALQTRTTGIPSMPPKPA